MYCRNCGQEIMEGSVFCSVCGTKVRTTTQDTSDQKAVESNDGVNIPNRENPNLEIVGEVKEKVNEASKKILKIKEGKGVISNDFYELILLFTVLGYAIIGGVIGNVIGKFVGGYSDSSFFYVMIGIILGVGAGAIKVMVAKLLLIISKNVHSITNNLVVINKNIEGLYPEEEKASGEQAD